MKTSLAPIAKKDWNPERAAHLLNRAGFGAPLDQVERAAQQDPEIVVNRLVDYEKADDAFDHPAWAKDGPPEAPDPRELRQLPEEERRNRQRERQRRNRQETEELRAWWLYRMRYTKRPLEEKLTLFWHGHFATGVKKVKSSYAMYLQNEMLRKQASGNWETLITEVSKDPAMLIYLDNVRSSRRAPNENYARELMELFTLGEGHYTEEDIKESARAFTGWTLDRRDFAFTKRSFMHDPDPKTFFGRTGRFDGEDVIRLILEKPRAAEFIAAKLWAFFAYADPEPELVKALGDVLRKNDYEIKPLLRTMFQSEAFYNDRAVRTQIKSPVQWLVGTLVVLDARMPPPQASANILRSLGQDLFEPPNVKGWDGGYAWITTANLLSRYNLAGSLCKGPDEDALRAATARFRRPATGDAPGSSEAPMMQAMMRRMRESGRLQGLAMSVDRVLPPEKRKDAETARKHLQWLLYQSPLRDQDVAAFRKLFQEVPPPAEWTDEDLRNILHLMMSTPQYQLT